VDSDQSNHLRRYFGQSAAIYADHIERAYGPLAASLVAYADIKSHDVVLDAGTGSGLAARFAAPQAATVYALDFSSEMTILASRLATRNVVQGDMHALPYPAATFDIVLAAFAFNSTNPSHTMRETARVLKNGGRLLIHEWGTVDDISDFVTDTLALYSVDEPSPELAAFREAQAIHLPWDDIYDIDDIESLLGNAGFVVDDVAVVVIPVRFESVEAFIAYKLAWPSRQMEYDALPPRVQKLLWGDLEENLAVHQHSDGSFVWEPNIIRMRAIYP